MHRAIAQSCDVYFYGVTDQIGIDRLHDFLIQFGFGEKTGIDMHGERSGTRAVARMEEEGFQEEGAAGLVPRRNGHRRHRPGLHARDAAAARARDRHHGHARHSGSSRDWCAPCATPQTGVVVELAADAACRTWRSRMRPIGTRSSAAWSASMQSRRHGVSGADGRAVPDGGQDRHRPGVLHRAEREVQRVGGRRAAARPRAVHRLRAGRGADNLPSAVVVENGRHGTVAAAHRAQGARRVPAASRGRAGRPRTPVPVTPPVGGIEE